ncbi:hypothetical protein [Pedobacter gandavensis]|uniref:hypothetical protein n=1 Tax=Pedobacter gandavensis TaxID=2679963 RepID=UPI00292F16FC|nr:hypothetical protein [Pedobacter gandavensis]
MKRISNIGFHIPSNNDNYIRLDSLNSLSETDIAILCPDFDNTNYSIYEGYSERGEYEGKRLYNKDSSAKILDHTKHWKTEILHFLENGGTLFILLSKKEDFYIYTGTKSVSGTGRNQKTTNHVTPYSNYNYLPFSSFEFHSASGKTVYPNSNLVSDLYKNCKDYFSFETYIKSDRITNSAFTTKNKDRTLGASLKIKNGFVIFLPILDFNSPKLTKYNEKTDKTTWSTEGLKLGKIFLNSLVQMDKVVRQEQDKTPKPNWLNDASFALKVSTITEAKINKIKEEVLKKQKEIAKLEHLLEEQESLKDLLFETGKLLEKAVIKALTILGYQAENYDDGELELDQIILSPEGQRFIGECEGKDSKDIDVSKFRQLLDGLNADFEKEIVQERASGLLIGNPQRLLPPNERSLSFTQKCQTGAKRELIGLIKTEDLFNICRYILETNDMDFAKDCRQCITDQLGGIVRFPQTK